MRIKIGLFVLLISILLLVILDRTIHPKTTDAIVSFATTHTQKNGNHVPPNTFIYDGCTLAPEGLLGSDWSAACLMHDVVYWSGGTADEKKTADKTLYTGVRESGVAGALVAPFVYGAVRIFGDTWLTRLFDANWGFGYNER